MSQEKEMEERRRAAKQSLNMLYMATRSLNKRADFHEELSKHYSIVFAALDPLPKDEEAKTTQEVPEAVKTKAVERSNKKTGKRKNQPVSDVNR